MRILVLADGRSPITRRWLEGLVERGISASLVSSFPCEPPSLEGKGRLEDFRVLPVAFSRFAAGPAATARGADQRGTAPSLVRQLRPVLLSLRYWLGPLSVRQLAGTWAAEVRRLKPDIVHALRIPYEGMLASSTPPGVPLAVSIWGNDLTLHARGSPWMGALTRRALRRADGLLADAARDLRLAGEWGYPAGRPTMEVPGSGGIRLEEIERLAAREPGIPGLPLEENRPLVVNPRGLRPGSLRTDTFFKAVPLVAERYPRVLFACPSLAGQPEALRWVAGLGIGEQVCLLPTLPQPDLWGLFRRAQVFVSPGAHDGTPNSLLEAMACGCFPVAGDIESLREWITPGENGLLFPTDDPRALADAICEGLDNPEVRAHAAGLNREIIQRRAAVGTVMRQVEGFYTTLLNQK